MKRNKSNNILEIISPVEIIKKYLPEKYTVKPKYGDSLTDFSIYIIEVKHGIFYSSKELKRVAIIELVWDKVLIYDKELYDIMMKIIPKIRDKTLWNDRFKVYKCWEGVADEKSI